MYIDIIGDFLTQLTTCHTPTENLKKNISLPDFLSLLRELRATTENILSDNMTKLAQPLR